jgi:O-antigen ligase
MNSSEMPSRGLISPLPRGLESDLVVAVGNDTVLQRSTAEPLGTYGRLRALGANSLVVAVLSPFIALTSGWVQRFLLALVILDIPFQFGTHLYYREDEAALGAQPGLSISITTIALAGLYASWVFRALASRHGEARPSAEIHLPLTLYVAIATLSLIVAQDVSLSFFEVFLHWQMYLVFIYVASSVRTRQDVLFVVSLLLIGCIAESLVIIVLQFTGMPSTIWGLPTHIRVDPGVGEGFTRIGGTVGSPNQAAGYLSLLLAPAASLLFTTLGRAQKWLATAVLGLGGVALIFTFSRGGWVAFALSILLLCLLAWRRNRFSLKVPIAGIVILAMLYLPFQSSISERLLGDDKGSAQSRIPLMMLAFRIVKDNPVLGVGSNNFQLVMDRYLTSEFRQGFRYAVHNKYLLVLAETGIGGLLAYLAFLLGTLRKGWQCWRLNDRLLAPFALGFTAALAGHMAQMGVDVFRGRPITQLVWLIAGLLTAMHRISAQSSDSLSNVT